MSSDEIDEREERDFKAVIRGEDGDHAESDLQRVMRPMMYTGGAMVAGAAFGWFAALSNVHSGFGIGIGELVQMPGTLDVAVLGIVGFALWTYILGMEVNSLGDDDE